MAKAPEGFEYRYRIDRVRDGGKVDEWFYPCDFATRAEANAYGRGRKYRGTLKVVRIKCRRSTGRVEYTFSADQGVKP
jgi:hypothetical protein